MKSVKRWIAGDSCKLEENMIPLLHSYDMSYLDLHPGHKLLVELLETTRMQIKVRKNIGCEFEVREGETILELDNCWFGIVLDSVMSIYSGLVSVAENFTSDHAYAMILCVTCRMISKRSVSMRCLAPKLS